MLQTLNHGYYSNAPHVLLIYNGREIQGWNLFLYYMLHFVFITHWMWRICKLFKRNKPVIIIIWWGFVCMDSTICLLWPNNGLHICFLKLYFMVETLKCTHNQNQFHILCFSPKKHYCSPELEKCYDCYPEGTFCCFTHTRDQLPGSTCGLTCMHSIIHFTPECWTRPGWQNIEVKQS